MTVAVGVSASKGLDQLGAAFEFRVVIFNTCVDDIGASTLAGRVIVVVGGTSGFLARETSKAPGSIRLLRFDGDN